MLYAFSEIFIFILLLFTGCQLPETGIEANYSARFNDYWNRGEGELISYRLEQARYGEIREGTAVMIYVTEDFSRSKQVKLDNPSESPGDAVKVLKLNHTRKFTTGIYPYSMMMSVFAPANTEQHIPALKVTTTSQEWCGHTFLQFNLADKYYKVAGFSYFESEGDYVTRIDRTWLEDEIWTQIRLNPDNLPTGEFQMIPGSMFIRLKHKDVKAQPVNAQLSYVGESMEYLVEYREINRKLTITCDKDFPYLVTGWQEEYTSGFGNNAKTMTTTATLKERIMLDYWNHNRVKDSVYRKKLGL